MLPPVDEIVANFELLDDWEERYRYLIELGRMLPTLPPEAHSDANKVQGCASQVWLDRRIEPAAPAPILHWRGDSDAHIVRGLIALLLALFSGKPASEVLAIDALVLFRGLGLSEHLTRVRSMVERIRSDARMEMLLDLLKRQVAISPRHSLPQFLLLRADELIERHQNK